jgi:hypothetical protein
MPMSRGMLRGVEVRADRLFTRRTGRSDSTRRGPSALPSPRQEPLTENSGKGPRWKQVAEPPVVPGRSPDSDAVSNGRTLPAPICTEDQWSPPTPDTTPRRATVGDFRLFSDASASGRMVSQGKGSSGPRQSPPDRRGLGPPGSEAERRLDPSPANHLTGKPTTTVALRMLEHAPAVTIEVGPDTGTAAEPSITTPSPGPGPSS